MSQELWPTAATTQDAPAGIGELVTLDTAFAKGASRGLYIGVTGHVLAVMAGDGAQVLFSNVPVGVLPIRCTMIKTVAGTATLIVALS